MSSDGFLVGNEISGLPIFSKNPIQNEFCPSIAIGKTTDSNESITDDFPREATKCPSVATGAMTIAKQAVQ